MEALFGAAAGAVPCLMFGAFAVIAVVVIVLGILHAQKRRKETQALARKWGLNFYPSDPWDLPTWYCRLDLFSHGRSRRASNVMSGEVDGRTVVDEDDHAAGLEVRQDRRDVAEYLAHAVSMVSLGRARFKRRVRRTDP
ncbi:MAG: hypothetical protein U9R68_07750 [Planctomycetota bacterium]|nr:hypothetical protein [Planctomycetota bacterium]